MRRANRRDSNEPELVIAARTLGALMWWVGEPVDWLCGWRGAWHAVEIKARHGRYTNQQARFMSSANAHGLRVWTWRTYQDVLDCLNAKATA